MEAARARTLDSSKSPAAPARPARMPGEDRRRQLLRVAVESFARNGFSGTKTKDIAAAAGVSEAILFRHFASKEDLYHAILDEHESAMGGGWLEEMNALAERSDDRGLFRHLAGRMIRSFREDIAFHRLLLYASLEGHLLADLFYERFGVPTGDFLGRYIARRQREGAFRKCEPATAALFVLGTVLHYAMARYIFGVNNLPAQEDEMVDQLVDLILRGLEQPSAGRRKRKGTRK